MIDIKLIRVDSTLVKDNIKKKFQKEKLALVDKIARNDTDWRKIKAQVDSLRAERNKISKEVAQAKKDKKDVRKLIKKAKEIPDKIVKFEDKATKLRKQLNSDLLEIPNIIHKSVPIGADASKNKEIRRWGKPIKPNFKIRNHVELIEKFGFGDFEVARKTSGQGFNYLLGEMAMLDHALQRYGVDFMIKKGFKLVVPPMLLNFQTFLGAASGLKDVQDVVYKIEDEDLYLIGTAEHTLAALLKGKTVQKNELPIKVCALTSCFRKEIGSHGVDTKGLFRMHQFNKVEQVVFSLPENSFKMLEEMQKITEEFFKSLKIPYRVIEICSGDLGDKFARQYDIEAWFPRQNAYAEITSAGNCTDFQARALNVKYWDKGERKHVHILNNTMVATSRAMVAILENFQQKDGTVKVPAVLVPYMNRKRVIGKK
ncbi:MAG: serine--tRNA ligase [Nanoarchaeota archaeon]|nr:serine--tRNA ligase [Nanoarchaeota archaeon]